MQKTRVYKIAQELNMTSKELIEKLEELDIKVTNHMSSLSMEEAEVIIELLGDKREEKEENMTKTEVEDIKHIETIKEQPKQEKYIIWNPKGCNPKKIHETLKSAEKEAERLALSQPNEDFYVLEVVKKVRGSVSASWE